MTVLGWVFLITSLACVWGLAAWCFYKVLSLEPSRSDEPPRG